MRSIWCFHTADSRVRSPELFQWALELLSNHYVRTITDSMGDCHQLCQGLRTSLNFIKCTVIHGEARLGFAQKKHGSIPALGVSSTLLLLWYICEAFTSLNNQVFTKWNQVLPENIQAIYTETNSFNSLRVHSIHFTLYLTHLSNLFTNEILLNSVWRVLKTSHIQCNIK